MRNVFGTVWIMFIKLYLRNFLLNLLNTTILTWIILNSLIFKLICYDLAFNFIIALRFLQYF